MQSIHSTVNVATLETNIGLHDSWTLGTFHMLWDLSSSNGDIWQPKKMKFEIIIQGNFKGLRNRELTS